MKQVLPSSRSRRSARGAASVEMAICMLVIVPVFLYALFLDDLLRYSLDTQEAALSTVWDLTVQDYSSKGDPSTVQHHARLMFCDHESGKERYASMTSHTGSEGKTTSNYSDCEGQDHHESLAAHVCWLNDNAEQVTCVGPDKSVGAVNAGGLYDDYHARFTKGGLYKCRARAVVENYLLPKSFLPEFSNDHETVNLTKDQWQGSVHENSTKGTKDNAYYIKEQHLAILTDTWALTDAVDIRPGQKDSGNALYQRVANVYQNRKNPGFEEMDKAAVSFFSDASDSLLNPSMTRPLAKAFPGSTEVMKADDPRRPNISIKPHPRGDGTEPTETIRQGGSGSQDYFNTEWRDWDKDRNRETYKKRGEFYMGCEDPEGC
ncbi:hypothetical protein [Archangium sp.]|uniref:hypothetical protein n=1 Tax=Archangium sp. TaxID=1872627 RepID=UPI002D4A40EA|nr:hypothetical protein [Archangium sp.]HYO57628.1 hypothetical protein [Archangium sp.]